MRRFVEEKKTSARVRFLMQDLIELKQNGRRKRREDAGAKTIDQIHKGKGYEGGERRRSTKGGRDRNGDRNSRFGYFVA